MSTKNRKLWDKKLLFKLIRLVFAISCLIAKTATSNYDDLTESNTAIFYTDQFVPDPLGLSFEAAPPETTTGFPKNPENWITDPTSYLLTEKSIKVRRVVKKIPNVIKTKYEKTFDQRYARRKNYSRIFKEDTEILKAAVVPDQMIFKAHICNYTHNYSFASFPRLKEIYEYLTYLELRSDGRAVVTPLQHHNFSWSFVHTKFGNEILSIRISTKRVRVHRENPIIVVVAGIHGRDWYAIQSAIFAAERLILDENVDVNENLDWWIIPVLNPDGYDLSRSNSNWRNWEKNLEETEEIRDDKCFGVDLDFAFEYQWLSCDESICDSNFPGEAPFKVPEARALRDTLEAFSDHLDSFVALKEGRQSLVYPFSDTLQSPRHVTCIEKVAKKAVKFFAKHVESVFEYGQSSHLMEPRAGYIEDWAKVHLGIAKSFAFYLGPREKDRRELKKQHLIDHMNGTFGVLKIIAKGKVPMYTENSSTNLDFSFICIFFHFFFILIGRK